MEERRAGGVRASSGIPCSHYAPALLASVTASAHGAAAIAVRRARSAATLRSAAAAAARRPAAPAVSSSARPVLLDGPAYDATPGDLTHDCRKDTFSSVPKRMRPSHSRAMASRKSSGSVLLSHRVSPAVPSALEGLTSVFGMGTGVAPPV